MNETGNFMCTEALFSQILCIRFILFVYYIAAIRFISNGPGNVVEGSSGSFEVGISGSTMLMREIVMDVEVNENSGELK